MIESFGHATQQQTLADLGIQAGEILCHVMAIGLNAHFRTNPCGHPLWHAPKHLKDSLPRRFVSVILASALFVCDARDRRQG
jgi:hypothetical protein